MLNSSRRPHTHLLAALAFFPFTFACSPDPELRSQPDADLYRSGQNQFPESSWAVVGDPGDLGWSNDTLAEAHATFETLDSAAVMIVHRGVVIASWGDVTERHNVASIRKPLLGALLGQEEASGRLSLDSTLRELGIDDEHQPLTPAELGASVKDLLQSRGAIYLSAIYEARSWKKYRPERGAHLPGEAWFYSNWGFNALGTIFEAVAEQSIAEAFADRIAEPIGMQDYRPRDVVPLDRSDISERMQDNNSEHTASIFFISARDLARFGLLYLSSGTWQETELVPADWIERTHHDTVETFEAFDGDRYGYLWWISPVDSQLGKLVGHPVFKATGGRGSKLALVPDLDLAVVHLVASGGLSLPAQLRRRFFGAPGVSDQHFNQLLQQIVAAMPTNPASNADTDGSPTPAGID